MENEGKVVTGECGGAKGRPALPAAASTPLAHRTGGRSTAYHHWQQIVGRWIQPCELCAHFYGSSAALPPHEDLRPSAEGTNDDVQVEE
ncbi:hypothetical protein PQR11_23830, partial [Paraburkholderia strydomiana]